MNADVFDVRVRRRSNSLIYGKERRNAVRAAFRIRRPPKPRQSKIPLKSKSVFRNPPPSCYCFLENPETAADESLMELRPGNTLLFHHPERTLTFPQQHLVRMADRTPGLLNLSAEILTALELSQSALVMSFGSEATKKRELLLGKFGASSGGLLDDDEREGEVEPSDYEPGLIFHAVAAVFENEKQIFDCSNCFFSSLLVSEDDEETLETAQVDSLDTLKGKLSVIDSKLDRFDGSRFTFAMSFFFQTTEGPPVTLTFAELHYSHLPDLARIATRKLTPSTLYSAGASKVQAKLLTTLTTPLYRVFLCANASPSRRRVEECRATLDALHLGFKAQDRAKRSRRALSSINLSLAEKVKAVRNDSAMNLLGDILEELQVIGSAVDEPEGSKRKSGGGSDSAAKSMLEEIQDLVRMMPKMQMTLVEVRDELDEAEDRADQAEETAKLAASRIPATPATPVAAAAPAQQQQFGDDMISKEAAQAEIARISAYYGDQLETMNEDMLAMQTDNDTLAAEAERLRQLGLKLQSENEALKASNPDVVSMLVDDEKARLEAEIDRLTDLVGQGADSEELSRLREENESLEENVGKLEEEKAELEERVGILMEDLDSERENLVRVRKIALKGGGADQWRKLLEENETLQATAARMSDAAQTSARRIRELEKDLAETVAAKDEAVRMAVQQAEERRAEEEEEEGESRPEGGVASAEATEAIRDLTLRCEEYEEVLQSLRNELASREGTIVHLRQSLEEVERDTAANDDEISRLKKAKESQASTASAKAREVVTLHEEMKLVVERLEEMKLKEGRLKVERSDLLAENGDLRGKNAQLSHRIRHLQATLDRFKDENSQHKRAIASSLEALTRQLTNIKKDNQKYQFLESKRGRMSAIRIQKLKEEHKEQIRKLHVKFRREMYFKIKDLQGNSERVDALMIQLQKKEGELRDLDERFRTVAKECEGYKEKFERLNTTHRVHERLLEHSPAAKKVDTPAKRVISQLRAKIKYLQEKMFDYEVLTSKLRRQTALVPSDPAAAPLERKKMSAAIQKLIFHVEKYKLEKKKYKHRCGILKKIIAQKNGLLMQFKQDIVSSEERLKQGELWRGE